MNLLMNKEAQKKQKKKNKLLSEIKWRKERVEELKGLENQLKELEKRIRGTRIKLIKTTYSGLIL